MQEQEEKQEQEQEQEQEQLAYQVQEQKFLHAYNNGEVHYELKYAESIYQIRTMLHYYYLSL